MSYNWFDPHFAALYARREEERLAERLVTELAAQARDLQEQLTTAPRPVNGCSASKIA